MSGQNIFSSSFICSLSSYFFSLLSSSPLPSPLKKILFRPLLNCFSISSFFLPSFSTLRSQLSSFFLFFITVTQDRIWPTRHRSSRQNYLQSHQHTPHRQSHTSSNQLHTHTSHSSSFSLPDLDGNESDASSDYYSTSSVTDEFVSQNYGNRNIDTSYDRFQELGLGLQDYQGDSPGVNLINIPIIFII